MPDTSPTEQKQLLALSPMFFVADLAGTIQYYQATLGFDENRDYSDPAFYASVSRDGIAFHLTVADVYLLYSKIFGRGAKVVYGPAKQDYGMKKFYVEDCNGYRLGFGQQQREA